MAGEQAFAGAAPPHPGFGQVRTVAADALVAPALAEAGMRVIVPYLRGHGGTRFLDRDGARSGQQAALGADTVALMSAPDIGQACLAGFRPGWPRRLRRGGALARSCSRPGECQRLKEFDEVIWRRHSPLWSFDDTTLARAAAAFDNVDYVDVVVHSYRHRPASAAGDPAYAALEEVLAGRPRITVPTVTLDGMADGNFPPTDGGSGAGLFTDPRSHHQVAGAGHNLPQEAPSAFVRAVLEAMAMSQGRAS